MTTEKMGAYLWTVGNKRTNSANDVLLCSTGILV